MDTFFFTRGHNESKLRIVAFASLEHIQCKELCDFFCCCCKVEFFFGKERTVHLVHLESCKIILKYKLM